MTLQAKQLEWHLQRPPEPKEMPDWWEGWLYPYQEPHAQIYLVGGQWLLRLAFPAQLPQEQFVTVEEAKAEAQRQLNEFVNAVGEVVKCSKFSTTCH